MWRQGEMPEQGVADGCPHNVGVASALRRLPELQGLEQRSMLRSKWSPPHWWPQLHFGLIALRLGRMNNMACKC
eukprot:3151502-Amphidinium_carterae.1